MSTHPNDALSPGLDQPSAPQIQPKSATSAEICQEKSLGSAEYVSALFAPSDHIAFFLRKLAPNGDTLDFTQKVVTAKEACTKTFQDWLQIKNRFEYDIYLCTNPVKSGADGRTKDEIETARRVFLDIDKDAQAAVERVSQSSLVPTPNFMLLTSPANGSWCGPSKG